MSLADCHGMTGNTHVLLLLIVLDAEVSGYTLRYNLYDILRCCDAAPAFFKTGLSRLLLLATLSSSLCFLEGVRNGKSAKL